MVIHQMLLGGSADEKTYVDDVFRTNVYVGDGTTSRNITNNIDLAGKGGMVWYRNREDGPHEMFDTERGVTKAIEAYDNGNEATVAQGVKAFLSNGFTIGSEDRANKNGDKCCAWTFREAPGFFDIVTWTGNGTANRKIPHKLGSAPGAIWIRRLTGSTGTNVSDWICYHRRANEGSYPWNYLDFLNRDIWPTNDSSGNYLYNVEPASDEFTIGSHQTVNNSGDDYVAYLFAHDDQRFGADGDEEIIKCGSYTGGGATQAINLGWEPQYVILKNSKVGAGGGSGGHWLQWDNMRGVTTGDGAGSGGPDESMSVNGSSAESEGNSINFTPTGFTLTTTSSFINSSSKPYYYIAIRRPDGYVGKPAESGTDVFNLAVGDGSSTAPAFISGFPTDFGLIKTPNATGHFQAMSRLTGVGNLETASNRDEEDYSGFTFDHDNGMIDPDWNSSYQTWQWKRHAGFDVVCHDMPSGGYATISHSLGKVPGMIWSKRRDSSQDWNCYHKGFNEGSSPFNYKIKMNSTDAYTEDTYCWGLNNLPDTDNFTVKTSSFPAGDYIFYLFADVENISKVGYWTSDGTNHTETLGFQPRLIIIRKANDAGGFQIFDSTRGITNKMLSLGSTNGHPNTAQDYFTVNSTGFTTVNADFRENNKEYIYYAHA